VDDEGEVVFRIAWNNAFIALPISPDCTMIIVRQQVKGSKTVRYLKTDAAYRVVDLCPEDAELLRKFIGDRRGLLFPL
jgi:hypothetical protein